MEVSNFIFCKQTQKKPFGPRFCSSCSENKNARHKRNGNLSFCTRATEEIFSNLLFLPQLTHNNDKRRPYFSTVAKKLSLLLAKKVEQEEMAKVKVVRKFGGS